MKRDIVLLPGLWMGRWIWQPVADRLGERGHNVHAITLPGLESSVDGADIGLATHVDEVLSVIDELDDVILVAHSYGGIVAGQVADRAPDRVAHTVFVESFLPYDGESMLDVFPDRVRDEELRQIAAHDGRWPVPDIADVSAGQGLTPGQARWLSERLVPHPGRTVSEPAVLSGWPADLRATYVVCTREHFDGKISDRLDALRKQPTWSFEYLDTGLWPMLSAPDELSAIIDGVAAQESVKSSASPWRAGPPESD